MNVTKRNEKKEVLKLDKVRAALKKCFYSQNNSISDILLDNIVNNLQIEDNIAVEKIQDQVENLLMKFGYFKEAKAYILYRNKHKELRYIEDRINYMNRYMKSSENAASSSETDANANTFIKNVANLDGEVYKTTNRSIQRYRMKKKLEELYPDLSEQYEKDINNHIIYIHDEASTPAVKNYCEAITLYPLLIHGTKTMDGLDIKPPHNLSSFCGQLINLTFLLSAQCKGAVAITELFNFFDYFCVKEWGNDYHLKDSTCADSNICLNKKTISQKIDQHFQQIVYSWNQPAGNRSYQSPFTNISYFDKYYWKALFEDFVFPDGTKPSWDRVSYLQKKFMNWFNEEREVTLLTFPVETMALLTDKSDIIDKEYKQITSNMYAKGHSFFTYLSDNPGSIASCCRLKNEIDENEFSFTNGLTGVQTGSCNVITLNLNRIIQDWFNSSTSEKNNLGLQKYLEEIVNRVHKYHITYKTLLYEVEEHGMLTSSTAGYISMNKLFSTIGLNGLNEAAEFLGLTCSYNEDYKKFCRLITGTISNLNKSNSSKKFKFNQEFVPAEGLSSKNYKWDKEDGYWVPENRNLYNSYFYLAHDNTSVLDKFRLHGKEFTELLDGGVGLHCNLEEHLSSSQYTKLIEFAIKKGTSYFTFNIPNTKCEECGHIVKSPKLTCPKCGSSNVTQWTRVIGFLRPIKSFDQERYKEALNRVYSNSVC